ncbi:MAG: GNAT family N-acetyltransferase [Deltaproteobacteria bacterium]|nr:GNAT family N-acetyltransferase [Deltaproteobacteria bacterium]
MNPPVIRIVERMQDVSRAEWDALAGAESPFLEWDWLQILEESGCATAARGWSPRHVLVEEAGRLVAACPMYLKHNSEGEFVFDYAFANASQQAGLAYYPKLLVAVPFTPAGGTRLLTAPGRERAPLLRLLGQALLELCDSAGLSSLHINFCRPDEVEALRSLGFLERVGMQYHWENRGYRDFEDYLSAFRSKRRNQIRRERRDVLEQGITLRVRAGEDIAESLVPTMYALYQGHVEKLYWGRLYLTPEFFTLVAQRFRRHLAWVFAEREGQVIAGTFNVQKNGVFYGRYWGAFHELRHLHFDVCYYAAVEHCIRTGIQRFEPGAGGEFKQLRGFDARPTYSLHHFSHPGLRQAVADYLERERTQMADLIAHTNLESVLKPRGEEGA